MKIRPSDRRKDRFGETNIRCLQLIYKRAQKTDVNDVGREGVDWGCLTEDRDRWRALVNRVMDLRVHKILEFLNPLRSC